MAEPRKHHYLPQFYLRGFSSKGKSICQIEKGSLRSYICSIRDVAAIRDYHELDHPDFPDANAIEKHLSQIEGHLARALADVIQSGITSPEIHQRMVELVSLMRFRVPAFKKFLETSLQQLVRSSGQIMERKGALPPPPQGLEDILRMDRLSIDISNWKCLEFMFRLAFDTEVLTILASMKLSILRVPPGAFFLTCDQPVAVYHPTVKADDPYGVGLTNPGIEVCLPLSDRVLLRLSWNDDGPREQILTSVEVDEFNRRTIVMADALVFASEPTKPTLDAVARYRHCASGMSFDVLDAGLKAIHMGRFRPVLANEHYPIVPPLG